MAQLNPTQPQSSSSSTQEDPLKPGTFQSLLPLVDDILSIIHSQITSSEKLSTAQASEDVATKAKQLASAIETMKLVSISLPGGHLSIDEIERLSERLDEEGEKRLSILSAFEGRQMPLIDLLGSQNTIDDVESVLPTPTGN